MFWRSSLLLLVSLVLALLAQANKGLERNIKLLNTSGSKVEIYWVHPTTGALTLMSAPDVMNGATFALDSFIGHEFEIRELASAKTGECKGEGQVCRTNYMTVTENSDQTATLNKDFEIVFEDDQIRAQNEAEGLVDDCQQAAKAKLAAAPGDAALATQVMDELVACVQQGMTATLSRTNEEIAFQAKIRTSMAAQMENYTCGDPNLGTSEPVDTSTWRGPDGVARKVNIMLDRPASRIHVIENFIDEDECAAMEAAAKPKLHQATVADGKGGSEFSPNRKAMQAGIRVPWRKEEEGDPIARVSRKVYNYVEHVLQLGITEHGQEDLMSIQYFGRGANDTTPDRYTPHCDGDCNGLPHKTGTRMATMVLYCTVPELGGHTNFRNAAVHVKPGFGNGIFFSYIDPETKVMDNGFTEHSGCPVIEGEKKIVTQWVRYGVDSKNPWTSFNTLGVKRSESE
eukprot:Nitzschia sp. Nitz4//scaffold246_size28974//4729//6245//NITZ4_008081-RA/size28974-snap-gene-0.1-mRNA-1//1//CDS//3329543909//2672//frame0